MPRILFLVVALTTVALKSGVGTLGRAQELTAPIANRRALGTPDGQVVIGTTIGFNCFGPDPVLAARYRSITHWSAFLHVLRFAACCAAWCYQVREYRRFSQALGALLPRGVHALNIALRRSAADIAISGQGV